MAPKSHRGAQPQTRPIKATHSWQHPPKAQRYAPTHQQQSSIAEIEDCTLPTTLAKVHANIQRGNPALQPLPLHGAPSVVETEGALDPRSAPAVHQKPRTIATPASRQRRCLGSRIQMAETRLTPSGKAAHS